MRIGDFTVFLISMKFFFSFQLAVYRMQTNCKLSILILPKTAYKTATT